jgi:hypothetical protein
MRSALLTSFLLFLLIVPKLCITNNSHNTLHNLITTTTVNTITGLGHLEGRGTGDFGRLVPRPARGEELAGAHHVRGPQERLGQLHHGQVRRLFLEYVWEGLFVLLLLKSLLLDCGGYFRTVSPVLLLLL